MAPNPKASLLTPPRELRDLIYDLVFLNTSVHIIGLLTSPPPSAPKSTQNHNALLHASRQLRHEAITPYYRLTTFYIDDSNLSISWYKNLDISQRADIRELRCVRSRTRQLVWLPDLYGQDYGLSYTRVTRESPHVLLGRVRGQFEQAGCAIRDGVLKVWVEKWNGRGFEGRWTAEPEDGERLG